MADENGDKSHTAKGTTAGQHPPTDATIVQILQTCSQQASLAGKASEKLGNASNIWAAEIPCFRASVNKWRSG